MSLLCSVCGEEYSTDNPIWRCSCGNTLDVKFSSKFPIDKIMTRLPNMWRYREAIPVSHPVSYCEGFTPIVREKISGKGIEPFVCRSDHNDFRHYKPSSIKQPLYH